MARVSRQSPTLERLGVRETMEAMETIVEVQYSGCYGNIVTEIDPLQRNIIDVIRISIAI
jgi:hypothetical protein